MRIIHVCSGNSADDHRAFHRECVSLAEAGYDVHLVAESPKREPYRERGVTVHPLPVCRSRCERLLRRTSVARQAVALVPDLLHVHEPELLGPTLARARTCPVVYDVRESYLDVLLDREWIPRPLRPAVRLAWDRRERQLLRGCAGIFVATERIAPRYRGVHSRVRVLANYPELGSLAALPIPARDGRTCVFAGVIAPNRGLLEVMRALALLKQRGLTVPFEIAGRPNTEEYLHFLLREAQRLGIGGHVRYHGVLSRCESIQLQNKASIGLMTLLPYGNGLVTWPVKMLECMALGLPLVYSDFPSLHDIAGVAGAGIACDPTDPSGIAEAVERVIRDSELARTLGEAGRRAVQERFNWGIEQQKMLSLYEEILGPMPRDSLGESTHPDRIARSPVDAAGRV
jgi:glycosyltransferase involved in cell wall biosynthesis